MRDSAKQGTWLGIFHRHTWGEWWLDEVEGGNMLGYKYKSQCRARRCETCLKTQIKTLSK